VLRFIERSPNRNPIEELYLEMVNSRREACFLNTTDLVSY
jgi:hypothetical protein